MNFQVEITRRAENDLREITAWYRARSGFDEVADAWADGFFEIIDQLAYSADNHPPANEAGLVDGDLREVHYGSGRRRTHRIVYEIVGDVVYILRVRHQAQKDLTPDELSR